MFQKLPSDSFKWKTNMLKFNEVFIKNYDEDSDKGYIFEADVEYAKNLHDLHSDLPLINVISLSAICMIKITMFFI